MDFDVFISHSSKDKTMADAVCAKLEGAGIRCWIAPRDITAGMTWSGEIMKAIDKCKVMVLVFSSNANESVQIVREVEAAVHRSKPILPVRIENILPSDSMAFFMNSVHWLDAISDPIDAHLDRLLQAVSSLLGVKPGPKKESEKEKPAPFNWKPFAYIAGAVFAAVIILLALLAQLFHSLGHSGNSPQIVTPAPVPVTPVVPANPIVSTPTPPTPAPPAPVAPSAPFAAPPPSNGSSIDPAMTGSWHLDTNILNYPGVVTLTYNSDGTYKMETVLSDSGTYQATAGQWTTTSSGSGLVRQGTYRYAGGHSVEMIGPLGEAFYSPVMPQPNLDPNNPVVLGAWQSTTHPRNSPPWNMTLTNNPDGTYTFQIDIVDRGIFKSANGSLTMTSHVLGVTVPGTYQSTGQNSMEFTGPLGSATWTKN